MMTYKIVLADDEPIIMRGLKKMIDWERLNAAVEGEANDGEQLMELIQKIQPDIVISDIAMPKVTGLEVIRFIKEHDLNIKVIFLSGFQEFSYAKEAITYGAVDYLLKPAAQEELEQSLLKAENQLRKDRPIELWEEENSFQALFRDMNSNQKYADLYEKFQELELETENRSFAGVCFAISNESEKNYPDKNKLTLLKFNVFKRIQDYLRKEKLGFVIKRSSNRMNTIFILPGESSSTPIDTVEFIQNWISREYKITLIVGIGDVVTNPAEIKYAYKTAKFAFELHYFQPDPVICYKNVSREFHQSFENYSDSYGEFLQSVLNKDSTWLDKLQNCLNIIEDLHYGNRYAAENRCIALALDFYRDLKEYKLIDADGEKQAEYENQVGKLRNQNSYTDLKTNFIDYFRKFIEKIYQNHKGESSVIYQVKEYIGEHFAEDISLDQIAKQVYMNPYYFSTFFKKETGQNFKSYLTEVRMKQALKILQKTNMKTYELAKAVGYKDVRTFADNFKEVYGESPAGFQKKRSP